MRKANLQGVNLVRADLRWADLEGAMLSRSSLYGANLSRANLSHAELQEASLIGADVSSADLSCADLSYANLSWANLSNSNFSGANLTGCRVYAISAWNVTLEKTIQSGLLIVREGEMDITVDNLEVAQFIYLLLNNQKIRDVIDAITSKVVLILGRFSPSRKAVLDALREELRQHDYLPVLFDFEKPASRDLTETVNTLAHLARFIIADLTEPNSIPHEVATIIPQLKVPVQPLLVQGDTIHEYPMFRDLRLYPWVLPTVRYEDTPGLLAALKEQVIEPAERKAKE